MMRRTTYLLVVICVVMVGVGHVSAKDDGKPAAPEGSDKTFTLKNKDIDIRDALQMIARTGGYNVVFGREVTGSIAVELVDVPLRKAFEAICLANGFVAHEFDEQAKILLVVSAEKAERLLRYRAITRRTDRGPSWRQFGGPRRQPMGPGMWRNGPQGPAGPGGPAGGEGQPESWDDDEGGY